MKVRNVVCERACLRVSSRFSSPPSSYHPPLFHSRCASPTLFDKALGCSSVSGVAASSSSGSDDDLVSAYSQQLTLAHPPPKRPRLGVSAEDSEAYVDCEVNSGRWSKGASMAARLPPGHKNAVRSFAALTQTSERVATACLTRAGWNVEAAIEHYYQNQQHYSEPMQAGVDDTRIRKLFERYANDPQDNLPNKIGPNGIFRLLADLNMEAEDRRVLILAFKLKAEIQCEFSWQEWKTGLTDLRVDSVDSLRARLNEIDVGLRESSQFKPLYQFTFAYGKNAGERNLALEVALTYWRILFKDQFCLLDLWEQFMREVHQKAVTKDTWNLLFDFAFSIQPDLSNYDEEGAWPVVLDSFVSWARPIIKGGAEAMQA